ncbi:MAG TPA: EF-P lysine aminoacylase GenX, partial [Polyangiaceae bacterium]|nr:EF-P lysine aminoacylase GenX [Polyangiaceae bacterium]
AHETPDDYFRILVETVEPAIASMDHPVFVTDYPADQASLARLRPRDPRFCERFELYVAGIELCNGFGELTDPEEQRQRLERDRVERREAGKPEYPVDERFLRALEEGMPPSGGNAMGLDRLLTLAVGGAGIADVLPCPASWA